MAALQPKSPGRLKQLTLKDISYQIDYRPQRVMSSSDIEPCEEIIGQARAIEAIKVGLHIKSRGYNIFVTGMGGTGRTTTIQHLLQQLNHHEPNLKDICYVNNFKNVDNPRVIVFEAGEGKQEEGGEEEKLDHGAEACHREVFSFPSDEASAAIARKSGSTWTEKSGSSKTEWAEKTARAERSAMPEGERFFVKE